MAGRRKIGITMNYIPVTKIWSNGLYQNILTLYKLLKKVENYDIFIILAAKTSEEVEDFKSNFPDIDIEEYGELFTPKNDYDLLLEVGYAWDSHHVKKLKAVNPTVKLVGISYGNLYHIFNESLVFGKPDSVPPINDYRDAQWISPHFEPTIEWFKLTFRTELVKIAPFVWSPDFLEKKIADNNLSLKDFQKTNLRRSIGVLEPNINVIKTCTTTAAIAEMAHRLGKDPYDQCYIFNGKKMLKSKVADMLFAKYDAVKDKKLFFEDRYQFVDIFTKHCGILLSHQHCNALNYIYLEALYCGIPMVHNSPYFKEAGYYYEEFDIKTGAEQLLKALKESKSEEEQTRDYYLWKHSPENPKNINGYVDLIEEVLKK